jgi:prevent-host-death family protein
MAIYTATQARANLYRLIDQVSKAHKPIHISGKQANAVLISEEDWSAIQETLYLLSVPDMRRSIQVGLKTPIKKCDKELDW